MVAVLWIVVGAILTHTKLYNHDECDMTYSHRRFYPVAVPGDESPYQLYKFTDRRDPRHAKLWGSNGPTDWCLNSGTNETVIPVLFIPGHGGDYQQGRSLGAHALGLTGAQYLDRPSIQRILQQTQGLMDVYAVDFNEEATALHGAYFVRQTNFVRKAIQQLVEVCGYESLAIVAHSMGGLVARVAAADLDDKVHAIVTLATPHERPILTWETTALQYHLQSRMLAPSERVVISIAGGLRDELIPPETCQLPDDPHFLSFLATSVMEMPKDEGKISPALGMDHKAIAWCHNILAPVRQILLSLHETRSKQSGERVDIIRRLLKLPDDMSVANSVQEEDDAFLVRWAHHFALVACISSFRSYIFLWA